MQQEPRPGGTEPYSNGTIAAQRTCLRSFFRWAKRERKITHNPAETLSALRLTLSYDPNPLDEADRGKLLRGILRPATFEEARGCLAIALGRFQGFRIHEAGKARLKDFDLKAGTLRVIGKGKKKADILPLHPVTKHCLGVMKKFQYDVFGDPRLVPVPYVLAHRGFPNKAPSIHSHSLHLAFKKTLSRCKIDRPHRFHDLRATYATELVEKGADEFVLIAYGRMTMETAVHYVKAPKKKMATVWDRFAKENKVLLKVVPEI